MFTRDVTQPLEDSIQRLETCPCGGCILAFMEERDGWRTVALFGQLNREVRSSLDELADALWETLGEYCHCNVWDL